MADMQEAGIPVTYGYISDLHERKADTRTGCTHRDAATTAGRPLGPGDSCYVDERAALRRGVPEVLRAPRRRRHHAGEHAVRDQRRGERPVRRRERRPGDAADPGRLRRRHHAVQLRDRPDRRAAGEHQGPALGTASAANTQFDIEPQGAAIYVHGQPAANDPAVRQLERDTAAMTNRTTRTAASTTRRSRSTRPARSSSACCTCRRPIRCGRRRTRCSRSRTTSSRTSGPNVSINTSFAYDHGYYSPNIDITWVGMAGPGVATNGVDGPQPADGNQAHDPESTNTVPQASTDGTWVEETDLRPTMLHLTGLSDDYQSDGHVITQALTSVPSALAATADLAKGYDQINSSVGQFATDTLLADTKALARGSASRRLRLRGGADDAAAARRRPRRGGDEDQADARERRGRRRCRATARSRAAWRT